MWKSIDNSEFTSIVDSVLDQVGKAPAEVLAMRIAASTIRSGIEHGKKSVEERERRRFASSLDRLSAEVRGYLTA